MSKLLIGAVSVMALCAATAARADDAICSCTTLLPNTGQPVTLTVLGGVPEPSTWSAMIVGIAAIGLALRVNRRRLAASQQPQ